MKIDAENTNRIALGASITVVTTEAYLVEDIHIGDVVSG